MKVVQINTVYNKGSTGKITYQIQNNSIEQGIENIVAYRYCEGSAKENTYCISTWFDCHAHNRISKYTHRVGFYSQIRTARFIQYLNRVQPNVIHLHNLHGAYINIEMLFKYIRNHKIKVIWTFHDCWPFTGYCAYFNIYQCEEWRNGCKQCTCEDSLLNYHNAEKCLKLKKTMVQGLDLTIVTPSVWLADMVRQTFFSQFNIVTIHNGLDLNVFHPRKSDFRKKHDIPEGKFIILGVAAVWEERKGLKDFIELSKRLDDRFRIVLVGTNDQIDKLIPENIISIHRTENQIQLAEIYTESDIFVNPTKDEVLGMVNIEANACGTPVVTYNSGGSPECINDESGIVVNCDDIDSLERAIITICETKPFLEEKCIACASKFDMHIQFKEYIDLYKNMSL